MCGITKAINGKINLVSFPFSWIPDLLLALARNAFAYSNSNCSPDL
jgi:hypothetical protein